MITSKIKNSPKLTIKIKYKNKLKIHRMKEGNKFMRIKLSNLMDKMLMRIWKMKNQLMSYLLKTKKDLKANIQMNIMKKLQMIINKNLQTNNQNTNRKHMKKA